MREIVAQFETGRSTATNSYGDGGCRLTRLAQCAMVLQHERYRDNTYDTINLFARPPEHGAQVFIDVRVVGDAKSDWRERVEFYHRQRRDFRLPSDQTFDESFLCPSASGFEHHEAWRTRDGHTRRRVVHLFEGSQRGVLLVYSIDSNDLLASTFFRTICDGLTLTNTAIGAPFKR